ncbi:MAG: hypothetical protein ACJAZO_001665 [Myxococcota bacterium]|jgi:hypothetical protein
MDLHDEAALVHLDRKGVETNSEAFATKAVRRRVQRLGHNERMVTTDPQRHPARGVIGGRWRRKKQGLLTGFERLLGLSPHGSVVARARDITTPTRDVAPGVVDI